MGDTNKNKRFILVEDVYDYFCAHWDKAQSPRVSKLEFDRTVKEMGIPMEQIMIKHNGTSRIRNVFDLAILYQRIADV